jgi:hypothetical protein
MFNNLFTNFKTEKELILHIIDRYSSDSLSQEYDKVARKEWKEKHYENGIPYQIYRWDSWFMKHLARTSDDEDIIRALYRIRHSRLLSDSRWLSMSVNTNLPDDLFNYCLTWNSDDIKQLTRMSKVEYKINGEIRNTKITNRINELIARKRKKKEDKTKIKLKAFLITADATKSVLTGKSIDDVVEATINNTVDEQVLDYMDEILDKGSKKDT